MNKTSFFIKTSQKKLIDAGYQRSRNGIVRKDGEGHYHALPGDKGHFIHYDYYGKNGHITLNNVFKLDLEEARLKRIMKRKEFKRNRRIEVVYQENGSCVLKQKISRAQRKSGRYERKIYLL